MAIEIDAETELKLLENSMRDVIQLVLKNKFGPQWPNNLKVSAERIARWKERLEAEKKRLSGKALDSRLIYYSDFYDINTIVKKHWNDGFSDVFDDLKTIEVFLGQMEKLRDPNAHRRELTNQQKCLIAGISGELRIQIMQYRGKGENVDSYFAVIEAIKDNLGNSYPCPNGGNMVVAEQILHVGDTIEFYVTSTDPNGRELEYSITRTGKPEDWQKENHKAITLTEEYIGKMCDFSIRIRTDKPYTALNGYDDIVSFRYIVLPVQK
ncbi:Swt1 family HEPN domain-containing protein [Burkholderia gladioli]|uniref:Swt1 family HEPN domain-containing protein n=1 Tax=Burkholderia gladioli TaxID=28095 RepID=UPI00164176BA|nr:Swt1 family HEPN domain-containing protein [Burkholderia gladioli]